MARKLTVCCLAVCAFAVALASGADDYDLEEREDIRKQLSFPKSATRKALILDNVFGGISVSGYTGEQVRLQARKTIYAESKQAVSNARKEVFLNISHTDGKLSIAVDGPFRDNCRGPKSVEYEVHYEFDLQVPHDTHLELSTVNNGDIHVKNVRGDFDVHNVNGPITLAHVAGSGRAHTVNGDVEVRFDRAPRASCSFKTLNGDLNLVFPGKPNADFMLRTVHGAVYTEFPVVSITPVAVKGERRKGKYVYKSHGFNRVRIGVGGPEIEVNGFNSDILLAAR